MANPAPTPLDSAASGASSRAGTPRRRLLADRAARRLVAGGGWAIIAGILGILVFILLEVLPLAVPARVAPAGAASLDGPLAGAMVADEHRELLVGLAADGVLRAHRPAGGAPVGQWPLLGATPTGAPGLLSIQAVPGAPQLAAATPDGRAVAVEIRFEVSFAGDRRRVEARPGAPVWFDLDPLGRPLGAFAARLGEEGATAAAQLADGSLAVVARQVRHPLFGGETVEEIRSAVPVEGRLTALVVDTDRRNLYAGTAEGRLLWWRLDGAPRLMGPAGGGAAVSALSLLIGDQALVVGHTDGRLGIWFRTGTEGSEQERSLVRVREFPAHGAPITLLAPSWRDKGFAAQDAAGSLGLYYSTSKRTLWRGPSPLPAAAALAFAPKADALFLVGGGEAGAGAPRLAALAVDNPHPQVSLRALFGRVWYEGAAAPVHAWQSTGGTDDFEPKLGLTPLLVGTLKGTLYSLLLAIPLGILGAMYTSQFMHPRLARAIKPAVEIMAALPSVVLGFLAGLWLAPRLERAFPALLLAQVVLPATILAAGAAWHALPRRFRDRFPTGIEAVWFVFVVAGALWLCVGLSRPLEGALFDGNFQGWLLAGLGLPYDQRNAVVIGLAMGFAVIPIIFAISEDAFSNVPRNLVAGSLALGANRWQTVTRVVLPTASPGIFSAIMVGFGRAVGETMIVLMATGNTPIMSFNPFNGFRTLSANIAVEIPEAPHGGTLYRVLFLAALLLFLLTFVVNTAAELVRQRLRRRYAQL